MSVALAKGQRRLFLYVDRFAVIGMIELHSPRRERKVRHGTSPQPSNGHHGWRDNAAWGRRHVLGAIACLLLGLASACNATSDATPAAVVDSSPDSNWQTIEYHGVRVDIPVAWERSDMDDCEFKFEHWAPLDSGACGRGSGVSFYASATFDPAEGLACTDPTRRVPMNRHGVATWVPGTSTCTSQTAAAISSSGCWTRFGTSSQGARSSAVWFADQRPG
jgi:hypothetical protein